MKILAIDDSPSALDVLTEAIRKARSNADVFPFDDPFELIKFAKETPCDIAFIDIQMPEMNGLELAVMLKKIKPSINIVFVTAYSKYAVEAMKLHPSGYVMKPATKKAVEQELENLRYPTEIENGKRVRVQTFGNFEVFVDGKRLVFSRSKSKELFAYLINRQGIAATTAEIAVIFWEDKPYNTSIKNQMQVIISDMMKVFRKHKIEDIIIKSRNQISVDCTKINCDFYDLLRWDARTVNSFYGEYMNNYSWAEITAAFLNKR